MRVIDPVLLTILRGNHTFVHIYQIEFPSGTIYLTDDQNVDITHNSQLYLGGKIQRPESITINGKPSTNDTKFTFNDADGTIKNLLLQGGWHGKKIIVHRLYFNENLSQKAQLYLWRGYLDSSESNSETSTITAASIWADFNKANGRKTNSASQKALYPDDKCFDETPNIVKDMPWGKAGPLTPRPDTKTPVLYPEDPKNDIDNPILEP